MKRLLSLVLAAFFLFGLAAVSAESDEKDLTVMVYMAGGALEDDYGIGSSEIMEMIDSGFDSEQTNLLILAGGARSWHDGFGGEGEASLLQTARGRKRILERYPELNMGDSESLALLLDYAQKKFPAKRYALILWGQGGGPTEGICFDGIRKDFLTLDELAAALEKTGFRKQKLSWIGFDTTDAGTVEMMSKTAPYAEYVIAPPFNEPASGWDYSFLKGTEQDRSGAETGKRIIDAYREAYEDYGEVQEYPLICLDLSEAAAVEAAMNDFFGQVAGKMDESLFGQLSGLAGFAHGTDPGLLDLVSLCECYEQVDPGAAAKVKDAVEKAIVCSSPNRGEGLGPAVGHPLGQQQENYGQWLEQYHQLGFCPGYTAYLDALAPFLAVQK